MMEQRHHQEYKHLLDLCPVRDDNAIQELSVIFEEIADNSNAALSINEDCLNFLSSNLLVEDSLPAIALLQKLKSQPLKNLESLDKLLVEKSSEILERALNAEDPHEKHKWAAKYLNLFVHFKHSEDVIDDLRKLASMGLSKAVYYALLVRNDDGLMKKFIKKDVSAYRPFYQTPDPGSMVDLVILERTHWLTQTIENCHAALIMTFDGLTKRLSFFHAFVVNLSIIYIMNDERYGDDEHFSKIISNIGESLKIIEKNDVCDSLALYFEEIKRENRIFQFCIDNKRRDKMQFGWLKQILNQSALSFISQNCDISSLDSDVLLKVLEDNNDALRKLYDLSESETSWEISIYKSYCVIVAVIDLIIDFDIFNELSCVNEKLEEIKRLYSMLTVDEEKVEVLQCIFICLFLRSEYFCEEQSIVKSGFICSRALTKKILYFLKNCVHELQTSEASSINEDALKLKRFVSEGIWKFQTITILKIDTNPKSNNAYSFVYEDIVMDQSSDEESNAISNNNKKKPRLRIKKRRKPSSNSKSDSKKDSPIQESVQFETEDFISLMLSPLSTLLSLCLENADFSRAYSIIELHNLQESPQAKEIKFTENLLNTVMQIKQQLRRTDKMTDSLTETSAHSATIISLVETFLSSNIQSLDSKSSELSKYHKQLDIYSQKYLPLLTVTDLAISTGLNKSITYGIMNIAEKKLEEATNGDINDSKVWNYVNFMKNMINLVYDLNKSPHSKYHNFGLCDILMRDQIPLKYKLYQTSVEFYDKISVIAKDIVTSKETLSIQLLADLVNLCNKHSIELYSSSDSRNGKSYLKHTLTYAKSLNELLNLLNNEEDMDMIRPDFLKLHVHEIINQLIEDNKAPLERIEAVCKFLGIDFIQQLVLNFCPSIQCFRRRSPKDCNFTEILLEMEDQSTSEELTPIPIILKHPMRKVMVHILIHNWVIGYLVKRINFDNTDYILKESVDTRTRFLDSYLSLDKFNNLKILYGNNGVVTALQSSHNTQNLKLLIKHLLKKNESVKCLDVLDSLPVNYFTLHPSLLDLKNEILLNLAKDSLVPNNWKYFLKISDPTLQVRNLFTVLPNWNGAGAKVVLNFMKTNVNFYKNDEIIKECNTWLNSIPVYEEIAKIHGYFSWSEVYKLSTEDPETVLQLLLDENQHKLCLKWQNIHKLSDNVQNLVIYNYLKVILKSEDFFTMTEFNNLLSELPINQSITLISESLNKIRDISLLKVCVEFLIANSEKSQYENIRIGVEILSITDEKEKIFFWDLIDRPLLIIEQYLMNAKFDKLSKILSKIRPLLKSDPYGDNLYFNISLINTCHISSNSVDALLRLYAAKSLDLRSSKINKDLQVSRKTDELILQSIDSINLIGETEKFVMPEEAPTREQWISNDYSESCMSCKTTIFSILIRKHHCRRCGRLVCYYCSRNRMAINNMYDGIKVRVCNDCHTQTINKANTGETKNYPATSFASNTSVYSEQMSMEWCLTTDIRHNHELRKEFTYEFSPNVTLFLTIMKMHTINYDYQRFLNEKSSDLLKSAKELGENMTGCDNICELLKMRKSLLVWSTVLYSQPLSASSSAFTNAMMVDTERQLAATDALTLLVSHGYHSLIPQKDTPDYSQCIRKLLEAEKWNLALEIATKFGFPRNSILATWGKACLRAGQFDSARQKFSFCLNKTSVSENLNTSSASIQQETFKTKSNPLLQEIITILENTSYVVNPQIIKKANSVKASHDKLISENKPNKKIEVDETAINIIHSLSTVQRIKMGDYTDFSTSPLYARKPKTVTALIKKSPPQSEKLENKLALDKFFYDECLFYLRMYGSHSSIVEFYLKYNNLNDALNYCHENSVEKEVFTDNLLYNCLKSNKINKLLTLMNEMDHTWNKWTDYILHFCRSLEYKGNLEALHMVQVGVEDFVRAAITCANLYIRPTNAPHANALHKRADYLFQAQAHLQRVPKKLSDSGSLEPSRTLQLRMDATSLNKHINTFRCQLEITSYLNNCEQKGNLINNIVNKVLTTSTMIDAPKNECFLPTLFSSHSRKIQLAAIIIVCSANIAEGYALSSKIIKEQNLDPTKVFSCVVKCLISIERYEDIILLSELIMNDKKPDSRKVCDTIVQISLDGIVKRCDSKNQLFDELAEVLIQKVESIAVKISCYIECRLLKTAYALAVKNERPGDLRKIMREAEKLGQTAVKNACAKRLKKMSLS